MKSIQQFFEEYKIQEFYDWQKKNTKTPIYPFRLNKHKKMSFGIIPGYRNYDLFYERYLSAVKILRDNKLVSPHMKVLDIGSGEGFFKFFFDAELSYTLQWTGVEVWKERAAFCKHIGYSIDEVDLEKGKLPYEDEQFDIVLASHVIEHIPNPAQIAGEMARVLKKGGVLLIATPTKPPLIADLDSFYHKLSNRKTGDTQQAFTHVRLEKMILEAVGVKKDAIIDKRGFRLFSSRKKLPLENWKWFYDISVYLGKKWMYLVPEVNIIVKK